MKYKVEVKAIGGWTHHSEHESYRDALDQAEMVHGRVANPPQYSIEHTHSGYAVVRSDGSRAEFLTSDEADEVATALAKGEAEDAEYEWQGPLTSEIE